MISLICGILKQKQKQKQIHKNPSSEIQRTDWCCQNWGMGSKGVGEMSEDSQNVQTSSYRDVMYSIVTIVNKNCIFENNLENKS